MSCASEIENVVLDGTSLTIDQVIAVSRGHILPDGSRRYARVSLASSCREYVQEVRIFIEENWLKEDAPAVYGFNTGVGPLKNYRISPEDNELFQYNIAVSHASGIGDPAPEEVVRATMLTRANALAKGVSGVRPVIIDRLLDMLNSGIHPFIPDQGSVGASGDLGPMCCVAIAMMGHPQAEVFYNGRSMPAQEAFALAGLPQELPFKGKEALAIANGCSFALGYGILALYDSWKILHSANLACAISLEAFRGEQAAFDARIQTSRNHPGQITVAAEILSYVSGTEWATDKGRQVRLTNDRSTEPWSPRVQDAYTLRCVPQVNGAAWDLLDFAEKVLEREMNGALDNPLIFPTGDGRGFEALSGGNFHGQQIAFATDILAMAIHEIGEISERRSSRMLDPALNCCIPRNLSGGKIGLDTGFPVTQNIAAAIVMENRTLVSPTSTDSIPNKSNQEDHVSMATWSARKARMVVDNLYKIIGIEFLCACQAVSLIEEDMGELKMGDITAKTYAQFRSCIPMVREDRFMYPLVREAVEFVRNGTVLKYTEKKFLI